MICFLTGRMDAPDTGELNPANGLLAELRRCLPKPCRALFICSDPEAHEKTDLYSGLTRAFMERAGFSFRSFRCLDGRNERQAAALIGQSELLILSGGHVPTQNRFFQKIGLRELLRLYGGVVVGISAGSMNSAALVYAQPEEDGEAVDSGYRKFLPGLGLTKTMLLPHYQEVKDDVLDGLRLFEDITLPDSRGHTFYAIPDGSYFLQTEDRREIRGEAYLISEGSIRKICEMGETVQI